MMRYHERSFLTQHFIPGFISFAWRFFFFCLSQSIIRKMLIFSASFQINIDNLVLIRVLESIQFFFQNFYEILVTCLYLSFAFVASVARDIRLISCAIINIVKRGVNSKNPSKLYRIAITTTITRATKRNFILELCPVISIKCAVTLACLCAPDSKFL